MKNETGDQSLEKTFLTPAQISARWYWNVESVSRKIRAGSIPSLVIGRRRLVRLTDVKKSKVMQQ